MGESYFLFRNSGRGRLPVQAWNPTPSRTSTHLNRDQAITEDQQLRSPTTPPYYFSKKYELTVCSNGP